MPFLSTHTDNSHAIPALETELVRYDVDITAYGLRPIAFSAPLSFRALPRMFLRALDQGMPSLGNKKMIDQNQIVEMATANPIMMQVP